MIPTAEEINRNAHQKGGPVLNSVPTTADRLDLCVAMVHKLIKSGKIRSVKIGARRLIPEEEIQRIAREGA
jgi:excisionase family DNA binding protein